MKVSIVGYGSIGKRHYRVFKELGATVAIVSSQFIDTELVFSSLSVCLETFCPDVVVIANRTSDHMQSLKVLNDSIFAGVVLVEKPLFESFQSISIDSLEGVYVAYNLRFHPILRALKSELNNQKIISAHVYCGQYLPTWRPDTDYRKCYSAKKEQGGGVLRDLSHELDYVYWLFGAPNRISAIGGQYSHLEISSDDSFSLLAAMENCCAMSLSINYLDKITQRKITVVADNNTYLADLIKGELIKNGEIILSDCDCSQTYHDQARAIINKDFKINCSFQEGLEVVRGIETIEKASKKGSWQALVK